MSKSLRRVKGALEEASLQVRILEMTSETRTAAQAADAAGCTLDQIAKSIIFKGEQSGHVVLFLTAGGNRVDPAKASDVAGQVLGKADAGLIRAETGFAIGGVPPVGHREPPVVILDEDLLGNDEIWAAAGTPNSVFRLTPRDLVAMTGGRTAAVRQD